MGNESLPPQYNDLIGDMLKKQSDENKMDNLPGFGKPLSKEYFSGDTFQHFQRIAKDAGYKPHWLKLQHEIRDELLAISKSGNSVEESQINERIFEVNNKITEYNKSCPPPMQKGRVSLQNIDKATEQWK